MATKNTVPVEVEAVEPTLQQIVNEGIAKVIEAHGIDVQKNRYKAMRAMAWQAFVEVIEADDFDALVQRAIANVGNLPSGWEIEAPAKRVATGGKHAANLASRVVAHEANANALNDCTCGEQFANKGALTRHIRRNIVPLVKKA
ncbi:hypothetical protein [Cryobacterium sp. BB307]|uniref:hypothetical protein n=1 Tax=Cryobacterium sp. BB307 TaxID=2716317 RepID=UPI001447C4F4|nr:hypothetical protein [Cryobacterium sp. BB307]